MDLTCTPLDGTRTGPDGARPDVLIAPPPTGTESATVPDATSPTATIPGAGVPIAGVSGTGVPIATSFTATTPGAGVPIAGVSGASVPMAVPGAAGQSLLDLVTGCLQPATVLGVHPAAVVLCCDGGDPSRVVTVLTAEASGVPNGVRTALRAVDRPFAHLSTGDAAFVGAGGVRLAGLRVQVVRTVRTGVPMIRCSPGSAAFADAVAAVAETARAAIRGVADAPVTALRHALSAGEPATLRSAVHALVGLGTGSTPGGDDVLAGVLAGLQATHRSVLAQQVAVAALADVATRTTVMSADLLRLAAAGHVCSEAAAVLRAVDTGGRPALQRALHRLLGIGHTSGADLATGLALGLATPTQPTPPHPRHRATASPRR